MPLRDGWLLLHHSYLRFRLTSSSNSSNSSKSRSSRRRRRLEEEGVELRGVTQTLALRVGDVVVMKK